jgi:type IV pilus assembly protein PilQ
MGVRSNRGGAGCWGLARIAASLGAGLWVIPALAQGQPAASAPPATSSAPAAATPAQPAGNITPQNVASAPSGGKKDEPELPSFCEVRVSEFMTVDLIVQNDDIRNVLQKLAVQSRRNIVPSQAVRQKVTATIYGVPFYDGLDALLSANGMGYIERGEFIYVYTGPELAILKADEKRRVVKVISLDYLRADDAISFARSLLSAEGKIEATRDTGGAGATSADKATSQSDGSIYTPGQNEFATLNALVVHDFPENAAEVEDLLHTLDTKPSQVLIEATIIQTTLTEANAFGVDFAVLSDVQFTDFFNFPRAFNPQGFRSQDRTPSEDEFTPDRDNRNFATSTAGNTGQGPATFRGGFIKNDIGVFIRALDEVSDVSLLSNPKVLTLNRQRARVLVGTRVGYLETTVVENQVLQSVKFIDTGIELDMRPFILQNQMIRLELAPKVSQVTFRTLTGVGGQNQQIPDEHIQTVNTDVHVPGGYTAVLGGLFREDVTNKRSQVPILGDIPLIGVPFRGQDDSTNRTEIIFLIKPTILQDRILVEQGQRGAEWGEAVRVGSRNGLLPWSRERQSARLNVEAERLAADGKIDAALWSVRRSLELNPTQPDAIRIRESLLSRPEVWPKRSIMERLIEAEAAGGAVMPLPGEPAPMQEQPAPVPVEPAPAPDPAPEP